MQFFIAIGVLLTLCSVYLLRQFLSRDLASDEAPSSDAAPADAERREQTLKAA